MRVVELKEDDEQFGHKAGDLFIVEDADYDDEKVVGVKITMHKVDNSFYKHQFKIGTFPAIRSAGEKVFLDISKESV